MFTLTLRPIYLRLDRHCTAARRLTLRHRLAGLAKRLARIS